MPIARPPARQRIVPLSTRRCNLLSATEEWPLTKFKVKKYIRSYYLKCLTITTMSDNGEFEYPAGSGRRYRIDQYVVLTGEHRTKPIKRTGRKCMEVLRSGYHIEMRFGVPWLTPGDRATDSGLIRNPLTHRDIKIGGRVYNNLVYAGWFQAGAGGGLVQPDGYRHLILTGNHRDMEEQLAAFETDMPYVYLLRLEDGAMARIRSHPPELKDVLGARGDLEEEYDPPEDGYRRLAEGEELFDGYMLVTPTTTIAHAQFLAAVEFNGFCVRQALEKLFPDEDWSDVPDHCGPTEMAIIARQHRIVIRVYGLNRRVKPMYEWGAVGDESGSHRRVANLYYLFNHVVPVYQVPIVFPAQDNPDIPSIYHDDPDEIIARMFETSDVEPVAPLAASSKDGPTFIGFSTLTHHHKLKFPGHQQAPIAWSATGAARRIFIDTNGGSPRIQPGLTPILKYVVQPGITFMREIKTPTRTYYDDQKRSFASYRKCQYYSGFPDPRGIKRKIRYDQDLLDPSSGLEGVVWVETVTPYPKSCFENYRMWAPFPQVRLAMARGEKFKGVAMIVTPRAAKDPYEDVKRILGEAEKRTFNKLVGRQFMTRVTPTAVATSVDELDLLKEEGYVAPKVIEHNGRKMWVCVKPRETVEKDPEYPLVAAYVHGYQKITLFLDIISKVDWEDVVRIWFDGVCLRKPLPFALSEDVWHPEVIRDYTPEKAPPPCSSLHKTALEWDEDELPTADYHPAFHQERVLIHGEPGTGKTYLVDTFFESEDFGAHTTASTNIAALNVRIDAETTHKFLGRFKKEPKRMRRLMKGKRIVIDEYTMLPQSIIAEVLALGYPTVLLGDNLQLCHPECPTVEWLLEQGFHGYELTTNHRTKDPETLALNRRCREILTDYPYYVAHYTKHAAREIVNERIINELRGKFVDRVRHPGAFERAHYIASTNDVVNAENVAYADTFRGDEGLWGRNTKKAKRQLRAKVAVGMLVIGIKNCKNFKNQEIGFITAILPNGKVKVRSTMAARVDEVVVSLRNLNPGFAVTFHRCQGQTFDFPIYVNTNRLFEPNMLYVAVTRVTHHKHLHLVK